MISSKIEWVFVQTGKIGMVSFISSMLSAIISGMRREAHSRFFLLNHEILPTDRMEIFDRIENEAVYEVIKVVDGVPVFFEEHMDRMRKSGEAAGMEIDPADRKILDEISTLVDRNHCTETNAKIVCARIGEEEVFLTYFIPTEDPGVEAWRSGIHTILLKAERKDRAQQVVDALEIRRGEGLDVPPEHRKRLQAVREALAEQ